MGCGTVRCNDGVMPTDDTSPVGIEESDPVVVANARRSYNRPTVWAGIAAFVVFGLYWVAIFTGQFHLTNPDKLHDATWGKRVQTICQPAATYINNLPNASTSKIAVERADLLDKGTTALVPMVRRLEAAEPPASAKEQAVVESWLKDWNVYLGDRTAFAAALRKNPSAQPLLTKTHGGWDTDAIDEMANANNAPDCATPQDM